MYPFTPSEVKQIKEAAPGAAVEIEIAGAREEFRAHLGGADVIYGMPNGEDLSHAPNLKWIQWGAAGIDSMDPAVKASPIPVTNMARVFAPGISETAMGLLLSLTRGIVKYYTPQFARREMKAVGTMKSDHYTEISGRTMGIVGLGGIGCSVARRAHFGFDMRIVAIDTRPVPKPDFVAELRDPTCLMDMVPAVDVLVAAAPLTPQTTRMFNESVFRSMKKTAYFLALSRGELMDDMALVKALNEGWIAGAGLDVFPQEPPPQDHPIFDCPNVVMSAHTSGWGPERQERLIAFFAENVRRYAIGQPLRNVVDKQAGY